MRVVIASLLAGFVLTAGGVTFAEKEEGWNPATTFPPLAPAEAIKTIELPKGYRLECIASEPRGEARGYKRRRHHGSAHGLHR